MSDQDAREYINKVFQDFRQKKDLHQLDFNNKDVFKDIILVYLSYVEKPEFSILVDNYKKEYILNESLVENNLSEEEQLGIAEMYDYISNFNFERDYFNLFTTSLILHSKLYSHCTYPGFGGKLRDSTVYLFDTNYEVVDSEIAKRYFNSLIATSDKIFEPLNDLSKKGYLKYIDSSIIQIVKLIELQPFSDGNKRTFRALLNLLFKKINIPPIYISENEKTYYKDALLLAIKEKDYNLIINFYYYKICDAILTLDIEHSVISQKSKF